MRIVLLVFLAWTMLPWGPYLAAAAAPSASNVAATEAPALEPVQHRCRTATLPGAGCWIDRLLAEDVPMPAPGPGASVPRPDEAPLRAGRSPEAPRGPPRHG